ncbi:hypothetical protein J6590_062538 [Homalodisca vitripennis]|nr:hypothetical protein J6590_062538 [Homalodisca vitripennis]
MFFPAHKHKHWHSRTWLFESTPRLPASPSLFLIFYVAPASSPDHAYAKSVHHNWYVDKPAGTPRDDAYDNMGDTMLAAPIDPKHYPSNLYALPDVIEVFLFKDLQHQADVRVAVDLSSNQVPALLEIVTYPALSTPTTDLTALHNLGHTDDRFFSQVQLGKPGCPIPALIRVAVAVSGSRQDMQSLSEPLMRSVTLSSGYGTIIGLSHEHLSGLELEDVHGTRLKSCVARSQHTSPSMVNMACRLR